MTQTVNNKANPYYAKQNHVRLPKNAVSKALIDTGAPGLLTPVRRELRFNVITSADPNMPTHDAGNLLVSGACNNATHSGVAPALAPPWAYVDDEAGGTNYSAALYDRIATSSAETLGWTSHNRPSGVWCFADAVFDVGRVFAGTGSTIVIPPLVGMSPQCLLGCLVMSRAGQANIADDIGVPMSAFGFIQRGTQTGPAAAWVGDTGSTLVDDFPGVSLPMTSGTSGYAGAIFAVRGAPSP